MSRITIPELLKVHSGVIVHHSKNGLAVSQVTRIEQAGDDINIVLGAALRACPKTGTWHRVPARERVIAAEARIAPMRFLGSINLLRKNGEAVCIRTDRNIPVVLRPPIGKRQYMPLPDFSLLS